MLTKSRKNSLNNKTLEEFFPIVGIGASAGGLEAATQLLKALSTNLGMGFVLVQHLDPIHESILAELLSKATANYPKMISDFLKNRRPQAPKSSP